MNVQNFHSSMNNNNSGQEQNNPALLLGVNWRNELSIAERTRIISQL